MFKQSQHNDYTFYSAIQHKGTLDLSTMSDELPASKLGTKEHWDMVYERETKEYEVGPNGFVMGASTLISAA
jgi:hypothetical protein